MRPAFRASAPATLARLLLSLTMLACARDSRSSESEVAWASWRADGVIGDTLTDSDATIGTILETAITSHGQIVVLDGAEKRVHAFDPEGRMLAQGAGAGDGPGELRDPVALAIIAGDSVVVLDRTHRRIELLTPVEDGLKPARFVTLDFAPEGACVLDAELFVLGTKDDV